MHTWPFNGDSFDAMHYDVMAQRGVPADQIKNTLEIDVDGTVKVLSQELEPEDHEALEDAGLTTREADQWHFADYDPTIPTGDDEWYTPENTWRF